MMGAQGRGESRLTSIVNFFRNKQNWPLLLFLALLLLWAKFIAPDLGQSSFTSIALFKSQYLSALPTGNPGDPVAKHVVIFVADGLRVDTSRTLPTFNQLRAQGAERILTVGQPSFSLPGWTVIGTGAWQEQSGIATNFTTDSIALDTIFLAAKRAGLTTAIVGSHQWKQLYASGVDTIPQLPNAYEEYTDLDAMLKSDDDMTTLALDALKTQPNLMLIHLLAVDSASHGFGGASEQAARAAQNVDKNLAKILAAIDLKDTALLVTADHGHVDKGGHGGWEPVVLHVPLVSAGKGIKPGQYPDALQTDIAPTVAVLLGTSIPSHNQGDALLDQIDAPDALKAARAVDNAVEVAARYDSMQHVVDGSVVLDHKAVIQAWDALHTDKNYGQAMTFASQSNSALRAQFAASQDARLNRERLARLPIAILFLIPPGLYLWWWRRAHWSWRVPVIGATVYFVLRYLMYFVVRGLTYSITMYNTEENVLPFIKARVTDTMIVLLITMVIVGILARRASPGQVARDAIYTMFLITAVLAVQILVFYAAWDVMFSWRMPDLQFGFKYYMDLFQTTAFWPLLYLPLAALLPFVAMLVAWIARRIVPGRSRVPMASPA